MSVVRETTPVGERASPAPPSLHSSTPPPWYSGLSGYQWFVMLVCFGGWFFDTFDMQLFILARAKAMGALLGPGVAMAEVNRVSGIATAVFMLGMATGGIVFGVLGDRWGRAKTLFLTVLCYSLFTGFSAISTSWVDFTMYRFLTGMGLGGAFAAAVALISETLPQRSRPNALAMLQALAAVGNMVAAGLTFFLRPGSTVGEIVGNKVAGMLGTWASGLPGWRLIFLVGITPALLMLLVMRKLKEPEAWVEARRNRENGVGTPEKLGSMRELFGDKRWRRNVLVGMALGMAGIMGLWGVAFWLPELVRTSLAASNPPLPPGKVDLYASLAMLLFNCAAAVGTYLFGVLMGGIGRKGAFAIGFVAAIASIVSVFGFMTTASQVWWMAPLLGFCTLSVLGGYSIYFPELFPLRMRATGVGTCYNTARYVAAIAPFTLGALTSLLVAHAGTERAAHGLSGLTLLGSLGSVDSPLRYAAIIVSGVYLIGLAALPFAVETKGKPLPE